MENNRLVDLSWLYVMYLEKTFQLSNGFKAVTEKYHPSVKKVFEFFACEEMQNEIKEQIFSILVKHKVFYFIYLWLVSKKEKGQS